MHTRSFLTKLICIALLSISNLKLPANEFDISATGIPQKSAEIFLAGDHVVVYLTDFDNKSTLVGASRERGKELWSRRTSSSLPTMVGNRLHVGKALISLDAGETEIRLPEGYLYADSNGVFIVNERTKTVERVDAEGNSKWILKFKELKFRRFRFAWLGAEGLILYGFESVCQVTRLGKVLWKHEIDRTETNLSTDVSYRTIDNKDYVVLVSRFKNPKLFRVKVLHPFSGKPFEIKRVLLQRLRTVQYSARGKRYNSIFKRGSRVYAAFGNRLRHVIYDLKSRREKKYSTSAPFIGPGYYIRGQNFFDVFTKRKVASFITDKFKVNVVFNEKYFGRIEKTEDLRNFEFFSYENLRKPWVGKLPYQSLGGIFFNNRDDLVLNIGRSQGKTKAYCLDLIKRTIHDLGEINVSQDIDLLGAILNGNEVIFVYRVIHTNKQKPSVRLKMATIGKEVKLR